ncbi:MAG: hypothetical protein IPL65_20630 [Lewinellaceae bacterium]|nr:hypothetical protein [Lewinellaceae bacterium]
MQHLKAILVCFSLVLGTATLNAQMYLKGQQDLHLGIGIGTTLYGSAYHSILPPLNVSYEKGITNNIGIGGYLGYAASRYNYGYANVDYFWRYNYVILGARGAYHYDLFKKPNLDTYGGLMLGFTFANARFHTNDSQINESAYSSPGASGVAFQAFSARATNSNPNSVPMQNWATGFLIST